MANIIGFIVLFLTCFVIFSGVMSFFIDDFTTAVTSVVATMCNIGPGLSGIGATQNYAWIPLPGKWVLTLCMLLGTIPLLTLGGGPRESSPAASMGREQGLPGAPVVTHGSDRTWSGRNGATLALVTIAARVGMDGTRVGSVRADELPDVSSYAS